MDATAPLAQTRRSLLPREHGAYAQLGLPLATVLLAGRPTLSSVCFALAACAAFVAHEPLLVVLGHRGSRALREDGTRASRRLVAATTASLASGLLAIALSPSLLPWAMVPLLLAAVTLVFVTRRSERSLGGELVASAALSATALPTALGSGLSPSVAVGISLVFFVASLLSTVEVRAIARREASVAARSGAWAAFIAVLIGLASELPYLALCALPTPLTLVAIAASRPRPASLRRLGWMLAASFMVTAGAVVAAARLDYMLGS